jgi:hypothetical protein
MKRKRKTMMIGRLMSHIDKLTGDALWPISSEGYNKPPIGRGPITYPHDVLRPPLATHTIG